MDWMANTDDRKMTTFWVLLEFQILHYSFIINDTIEFLIKRNSVGIGEAGIPVTKITHIISHLPSSKRLAAMS